MRFSARALLGLAAVALLAGGSLVVTKEGWAGPLLAVAFGDAAASGYWPDVARAGARALVVLLAGWPLLAVVVLLAGWRGSR